MLKHARQIEPHLALNCGNTTSEPQASCAQCIMVFRKIGKTQTAITFLGNENRQQIRDHTASIYTFFHEGNHQSALGRSHDGNSEGKPEPGLVGGGGGLPQCFLTNCVV